VIVFFVSILMTMDATAQTVVGTTTHLMHPSGIPATVTTTERGTVTNVEGKDVAKTSETDVRAHLDAVQALVRGGFRLSETVVQPDY
jgi:hypothetical protein